MNKFGIFYPLLTGTDNPILRKKSAPILHFDQEVKDFAKVLLTLMYEYDGVGLAASQLGENIRMVALTQRKEQKAPKGKTPNRKLIGEYIMIINTRVMKRPLIIEEERINFNAESEN